MANIYTRKAVSTIIGDEALTAEEKTERLFSLYGQALDDGYVSKSAAQAAQNSAVEKAKEEALKGYTPPDVKQSEEYKALSGEFESYKAMQTARMSEDFAAVKPKFFETVYNMIDRSGGAKPASEQLSEIQKQFGEFFTEEKPSQPDRPLFGASPEGGAPSGKGGKSFMDTWGFIPPKQ